MFDWKKNWKPLALIAGVFAAAYYMPLGAGRFQNAIFEALYLLQEYARAHVLLCLVPAFFIAGAIAVFINQAAVTKYLGPSANKVVAYGVASISGTILAVCSCTVLPLFAGIYRMGAGLGPATAFLYSGPAINVLAIILTARILGLPLGIARAVGAVLFSIAIGLTMAFLFRKEDAEKARAAMAQPDVEEPRPLWQTALYFAAMVGVLVSATWAAPTEPNPVWEAIYNIKWILVSLFASGIGVMLILWFGMKWWKVVAAAIPPVILALALPDHPTFADSPAPAFALPDNATIAFVAGIIGLSVITSSNKGEAGEWFSSTWGFAKQILPLLFMGVLVAGALLGRPGHEGLIPSEWVYRAVGGNSLSANLFASVAGAFMYFATLTEVPILQGLIGNGMGQGPALALLLAGPALSLPNMLVIRSVLGTKKTVTFVTLVIAMATVSGIIYGMIAG